MALVYRGRIVDLSGLPVGKEVTLPKHGVSIGPDFEETPLGHLDGALKQYRGPLCAHLREFKNHFTLHRDAIDPRFDPIGHLAIDAPDDLVGIGLGSACGYAAAKAVYKARKDESNTATIESLLIGTAVAVGAYYVGKSVTRRLQGK